MFEWIMSSDNTDIQGSPDPDHFASLRVSYDSWSPNRRSTIKLSQTFAQSRWGLNNLVCGQWFFRMQSATETVTQVYAGLQSVPDDAAANRISPIGV